MICISSSRSLRIPLGFSSQCLWFFFRDLKEVVTIGVQIWFWFTPIVYVFEILPPACPADPDLEPVLAVISAYHDIFVFQKMPSFIYLSIVLIISIVLIVLDYVIFKKLEKDIRDFI